MINIKTKQIEGKIKPMHSVNNGPVAGNKSDFELVKFPFIRNHDASFYAAYGSEHTVDISAVFPDFDKDPYKEESYDFAITDEYIKSIKAVGCDVFYRLGQRIEHNVKKYGAHPPKDFKKWAVICEHIIKHYNEGWCDGFNLDIKYWEIWNEPDNNPVCWTGTEDQFFELFKTSAKHLKETCPNVYIGGPAFAEWSIDNDTVYNFVKFMKENEVLFDFLSWHTYSRNIEDYLRRAKRVRSILDEFGYNKTKSILNEWNYLISWSEIKESQKKQRGIEGACMVSALMAEGQKSSVDMLMYYDARPCTWNGLFDFYTLDRLKAFYPFYMFSKLYDIKNEIVSESDDEDVYVVGASDGEKTAAMITYYTYDETKTDKKVKISFDDLGKYNVILHDDDNDFKTVGCFEMKSFEITLKPNSILFIESN